MKKDDQEKEKEKKKKGRNQSWGHLKATTPDHLQVFHSGDHILCLSVSMCFFILLLLFLKKT